MNRFGICGFKCFSVLMHQKCSQAILGMIAGNWSDTKLYIAQLVIACCLLKIIINCFAFMLSLLLLSLLLSRSVVNTVQAEQEE